MRSALPLALIVATACAGPGPKDDDALPTDADDPGASFGAFRWGSITRKASPVRLTPDGADGVLFHSGALGDTAGIWRMTPADPKAPTVRASGSQAFAPLPGGEALMAAPGGLDGLGRVTADGSLIWHVPGRFPVHDVSVEAGGATAVALVGTAFEGLPVDLFGTSAATLLIARFDLASGEVVDAWPIGPTRLGGRILALPDGAFALIFQLDNETVDAPEGTLGRADGRGPILEVREADGALRWRRWLGPSAQIAQPSLRLGPDGQLIAWHSVRGAWNAGFGLHSTGDQYWPLAVAFDLDTGDGRWERWTEVTGELGQSGLAVRDDGRMVWAQPVSNTVDFGGDVGVISAATPGDTKLAIVSLDGCGVAKAAQTYVECDCTYDDPRGAAVVWDATFTDAGDVALGMIVYGHFRFGQGPLGPPLSGFIETDVGSVGEAYGAVVVLGGPAPAVTPPTCPAPDLPVPTVAVSIADGGAIRSDRGDCDTDCALPGELFETATLEAVPEPGYRFTGWTGACSGLGPCVVRLDDSTTDVGAGFTPTLFDPPVPLGPGAPTLIGARLAVAADGGTLLAAAVQGDLDIAGEVARDGEGIVGVLARISSSGTLTWATVLDADSGQTFPKAIVPNGDGGATVAAEYGSDLRILTIDGDGDVTADARASGFSMPRFGRDDAGAWYATHRASARESQLVGLAHDGARVFTHAAVATGWVETSDLLALADGAAVLFPFQGDLTLGGTTLTGGGAALLVVDGDGEVVSFARLPGGAPVGFVGPSEGALSRDGEGLVLTGLTNRLGLSGSAWLEPITADGALRGDPWNPGVLLGGYAYGAAAPIRPLATSWAAACNTWSTDVIAGLPIEQYGGWDNCVARVEPGGVRALETFGGPGDDAWWATATDGDRVFVGLASANPNGGFAGGRPVPAYYLVRAAF